MYTYSFGNYITRCIGLSSIGCRTIEWQIVQYYNDLPIARFKVREIV